MGQISLAKAGNEEGGSTPCRRLVSSRTPGKIVAQATANGDEVLHGQMQSRHQPPLQQGGDNSISHSTPPRRALAADHGAYRHHPARLRATFRREIRYITSPIVAPPLHRFIPTSAFNPRGTTLLFSSFRLLSIFPDQIMSGINRRARDSGSLPSRESAFQCQK